MPGVSVSYSENELIERPAVELFERLGWQTANCFHEFDVPGGSPLGRETKGEVVLISRLRPALQQLNPQIPAESIEQAIEEITRDRSAMSLPAANREVYELLKNGIRVSVRGSEGKDEETIQTVRVIDWDEASNNDFFLASEFWVTGEVYTRRADLVGFVNGLPLVFIELKASHKRIETAYNKNLRDYKQTVAHIFWYNVFIILSNGSKSRVGSITAPWEHLNEWKKINSEGEAGVVSLETMIRGTCDPPKLLDLAENFVLFEECKGGLAKLLAKNHQYLGVNNAIEALRQIKGSKGRLGVFWHTQGSGKSISMIFFSQKVLRKIPGNWTFLIVTDRKELDRQIYGRFANTGIITEKQARATSGDRLKQLLQENHRYLFTLIQKFHTKKGLEYPGLSNRTDIIVMVDEAHRTQYDALAFNMHSALPKAAFIAFTGTPLIVGEEKTRQVFGDYVSVYNFRQSTDDGATVRLYYENRVPELQLENEEFNEDMERLLEEAELDAEQEKKLEREFRKEYRIITAEDRLEKTAKDIVTHFIARGYRGKGMVVCIDKATAVKMYDKVNKYWAENLRCLQEKLSETPIEDRDEVEEEIRFMEETDMAVVVSQSQNEIEELADKGVDIRPHRRRMNNEDLDTKFKDPDDPFRIVFVCAMWMTGFDVPSCSTIYLDKPMRNHTLMQAMARANRVFGNKVSGHIVDYVGVFREVENTLAIYGSGSGGGVRPGDNPVDDKSVLIDHLRRLLEEAIEFCAELEIDLAKIQMVEGFERVRLLDDAVDAILVNDESKRRFVSLAANMTKYYKAILPDPVAAEFGGLQRLLSVLAEKIRALTPVVDISGIIRQIDELVSRSIVAKPGVGGDKTDEAYATDHFVDLSKIDFDALKAKFENGRKRILAQRLRTVVTAKLSKLLLLNRTRADYQEMLERLIDEYNAGSVNVEHFFDQLMTFAQSLNSEEQRAIAEQLSEEELAIFDLLTKPDMKLTKKEKLSVKRVAGNLLQVLKKEKLVLDWRKRQQSRAAVRLAIEETLDRLPDSYSRKVYLQKCEAIYQHVYESYYGEDQSVYALVS